MKRPYVEIMRVLLRCLADRCWKSRTTTLDYKIIIYIMKKDGTKVPSFFNNNVIFIQMYPISLIAVRMRHYMQGCLCLGNP